VAVIISGRRSASRASGRAFLNITGAPNEALY
jgi:hypothetical protein